LPPEPRQEPKREPARSRGSSPTPQDVGATPEARPTGGFVSSPEGVVTRRAIANTIYRGVGEIAGRLASLALFAVVARRLGEHGLGAFVFAVAYLGVVMVAVDLGLDRYLLRAVAREQRVADHAFSNVIALKLALAIPLFALGLGGLALAGQSPETQLIVLALAPGVLADSIARTQSSFFAARERGGPPSLADAIQRICSAALGIAALELGYGVVSVGVTYSIGSAIGVVVGFVLLHRTIGIPTRSISHRRWRSLATQSIPYAVQDTFSVMLARMDQLLLGLLATAAAVGRYGGAYRLFESTFFATYALTSAFAAMYTYLDADSHPPLRIMFQRSIKLSLVLLMPVAVAFTVLATPICRLVYGAGFASATSLRILGPGVALMSIVTLGISLMVSRENPRRMVLPAAAIAALNVVLNLVFIPVYHEVAAASVMLFTETVYVVWIMVRANRAVGGMQWAQTFLGTITAAAAMTAVALPLDAHLPAALGCGVAAYTIVLLLVERLLSPLDVALVTDIVRHRLRLIAPSSS
jgi:O-antigen/teichoic acid export membrane protein